MNLLGLAFGLSAVWLIAMLAGKSGFIHVIPLFAFALGTIYVARYRRERQTKM